MSKIKIFFFEKILNKFYYIIVTAHSYSYVWFLLEPVPVMVYILLVYMFSLFFIVAITYIDSTLLVFTIKKLVLVIIFFI